MVLLTSLCLKCLGLLSLLVIQTRSSATKNSTSEIRVSLGASVNPTDTNSKSISNKVRNTGIGESEDSPKEEIARLLDLLNATSLKVSELVSPQNGSESNDEIKSRLGPKEFISLIKLIEGVRKFVDSESTRVSAQQDASQTDFISSSLKGIQKFFKEHDQILGAAIKQVNPDTSSNSSSSTISSGTSSSDSSGVDSDSGSETGASGSTEFPIVGGNGIHASSSRGRNETSRRSGRAGIVTNFMKISSDMSRGVEERMRQAGNVLQESVNQVQNQIGSFMARIGGFI